MGVTIFYRYRGDVPGHDAVWPAYFIVLLKVDKRKLIKYEENGK